MHVIVNKLLTTYSETGSGDKLLLVLHGWADSGKTFDMLSREIIVADSRYRVISVDLPGFGATTPPDTAWGVSDYALFVRDFLKKIHQQPTAIIAHSNGGTIAINGVARGILSVEALILIGSAGIRDKSIKKEAMRLLSKPAKLAIKATPPSTQKRIRQKLYTVIGSDYLVAEHMQETFKKIVSYDVRNEATAATIPTCLIYGENDTATPPVYGKLLAAAIPNAMLTIIPLAGHFVHQEQAHNVARIITDFINGKSNK